MFYQNLVHAPYYTANAQSFYTQMFHQLNSEQVCESRYGQMSNQWSSENNNYIRSNFKQSSTKILFLKHLSDN